MPFTRDNNNMLSPARAGETGLVISGTESWRASRPHRRRVDRAAPRHRMVTGELKQAVEAASCYCTVLIVIGALQITKLLVSIPNLLCGSASSAAASERNSIRWYEAWRSPEARRGAMRISALSPDVRTGGVVRRRWGGVRARACTEA